MRRQPKGVGSVLSPLERNILGVLWPGKKLRVRHIYEVLKKKQQLALSSVAVLLDRLHSKGIVGRKVEKARGGVRYVYFPLRDKKSFEISTLESAVNRLIKLFGPSAVSYFNQRFAHNADQHTGTPFYDKNIQQGRKAQTSDKSKKQGKR